MAEKTGGIFLKWEHIVIAILAIAVIALGYTYLVEPEKIQQALQGTTAPAIEVKQVTSETEVAGAVSDIGTNIKGLGQTLEEIDQSLG